MTQTTDTEQSIQDALTRAASFLPRDPAQAMELAQAVLQARPESIGATQIIASALRRQQKLSESVALLEPLADKLPNAAPVLHELALCYSALGLGSRALEVLRRTVSIDPGYSDAWRSLGNQLILEGRDAESTAALQKHLATSTPHPELVAAAEHFQAGSLAKAELAIRDILKTHPTDVSAMRLLADLGIKVGQYQDARNLLERCIELAPDYHLARNNYAVVLMRQQELPQALEQVNKLLEVEPDNPGYLLLKGSVLVRTGEHLAALQIYERVLEHYPNQSGPQLNYGHTLKTVGRLDEAITAYRKAIEISPGLGEAYWSLANLKTYRFSDDDIASMKLAVTQADGDPADQSHLGFALGKALEDRKDFDQAFHFYRRGNAIRRETHPFHSKRHMHDAVRQVHVCTQRFFSEREGAGCSAPDPIFIVGLPRAGSTLLEQILASHSAVEGTAELPDVIALSRRLAARTKEKPAGQYPEVLSSVSNAQFAEFGEGYLDSTRIQRTDLPYFIDKMPNNFMHIGLIHLILPNAKIIDARRHPMAGCFAGYKQLFAEGQTFTYDLTDIGHYYRTYVRLMDHWDQVLPGRVLRVQYENMVNDTETQIRRTLDYCKLPFESQCLRFYETDRAVRTPSSEQVRQPIFTAGLDQWRHFEAHLEPLKTALGPLLERYPVDS